MSAVLSKNDAESAAWKKMKAWAEERLERARVRLEARLDYDETMRLRGRVAELRTFLKLDEAEEPPQDDGKHFD